MNKIVFIVIYINFLQTQIIDLNENQNNNNNLVLDKAIEDYTKLQKKYSDNKNINFNLGNLLYANNNLDQAIKEFNKSLDIDNYKLKSESYYNLGNAYYKSGDLEKSLNHYRKALELNPNDYDAIHNYELVQQIQKQQENSEQQDESDKKNDDKEQEGSEQKDESSI